MTNEPWFWFGIGVVSCLGVAVASAVAVIKIAKSKFPRMPSAVEMHGRAQQVNLVLLDIARGKLTREEMIERAQKVCVERGLGR